MRTNYKRSQQFDLLTIKFAEPLIKKVSKWLFYVLLWLQNDFSKPITEIFYVNDFYSFILIVLQQQKMNIKNKVRG